MQDYEQNNRLERILKRIEAAIYVAGRTQPVVVQGQSSPAQVTVEASTQDWQLQVVQLASVLAEGATTTEPVAAQVVGSGHWLVSLERVGTPTASFRLALESSPDGITWFEVFAIDWKPFTTSHKAIYPVDRVAGSYWRLSVSIEGSTVTGAGYNITSWLVHADD